LNEKKNIPQWLLKPDEPFEVGKKERFIEKNILTLFKLLAAIRSRSSDHCFLSRIHPALKLFSLVVLLFLISLSRSMVFISTVGSCMLLLISILPVNIMKRILIMSLTAAVFMAVTLLPAFLVGIHGHYLLVVVKVWLTVSFSGLLMLTTSWHALIAALKLFRVPDLFILILDITLKYIVIFSDFTLNMFYALKLRSVGKNAKKAAPVAGIAGTLFLKSKEMSEDLYDAMVCRGFSGHYATQVKRQWHWMDTACSVFVLALALSFFYFR
jgi:cobalt/nickel transport system permease protein